MFAGLNQTGRRVVGPAADLVELEDGPDGAKSTALVYHERYRQHEVLHVGIELIQTFLEVPLVAGLVEMNKWIPEEGAFIFPTGQSISVTEIVRTQREMKHIAFGPRSAAEVLYLAGMIFSDAADTGPSHGVYSHGSFGPQHLLLKTDGQVQIIGHGIPAVDVFAWREDEAMLPHEDTFRYSPPERLAVEAEDVTTDLFGLSLLVYELVTGEAVYDGNIEKLRDMAVKGEAQRIVRANRNLPAQLRDLLATALAADMSKRGSAAEFVAQTEALLGAVSGPGIAECMEAIAGNLRRGRSLAAPAAAAGAVRGGRGVPMKSAEGAHRREGGMVGLAIGRPSQRGAAKAAAEAAAAAAHAPTPEAADGGSRWGKVRRDRGTVEAPAAPAAPAAPPPAPREDARAALRDRLKARQAGGEAAAAPHAAAPAAAAPAAPAQEDARAALRDRLKRGREGDEAKPAAPAAPAAPPKPEIEDKPAAAADPRAALRERLRAKSGDAEAKAAEPAAEAPKAEAPKAEAPKAEAPKAEAAEVDPRAALRDRLRQKAAAAEAPAEKAPEPAAEPPKPEPAAEKPAEAAPAPEPPKAEPPKAEPPKAEPPKAEPPKATEPAKTEAAPAGESLRDRLKRQREEAAASGAPAAPAAAPPAPAAAAPPAPAAEPAGDKPAEDPREALRRRLRERQGG